MTVNDHASTFEPHRGRLYGIAYRMLGSRADAEDIAAFLLHEVFDSDYGEIAQILGKGEVACRQLVSRALRRVREDRPRVQVSETARKAVLSRFVDAVMAQDKDALMQVLAADVTWVSDGGGKAKAARKLVRGADHVARFIMGVIGRFAPLVELRPIVINGEAGRVRERQRGK
jgi:RNA polymerase sigma-70 factor (ECF subfamily)